MLIESLPKLRRLILLGLGLVIVCIVSLVLIIRFSCDFCGSTPLKLLTEECNISCWDNLVVGIISESEVTNHLASIGSLEASNNGLTLTDQHGSVISIQFAGGVLDHITLTASKFALSLEQIVEVLGPPKYAWVRYFHRLEAAFLGSRQTVDASLTVYYPDRGYAFSSPLESHVQNGSLSVCIEEGNMIDQVNVVSIGSIDQMLTKLGLVENDVPNAARLSNVLSRLRPLIDYGCTSIRFPASDGIIESW